MPKAYGELKLGNKKKRSEVERLNPGFYYPVEVAEDGVGGEGGTQSHGLLGC